MKRICSLFLATIMIISVLTSTPITVSAASSGTLSQNISWELSDDGVLIISGYGDMKDYDYNSRSPFRDSTDIKEVVITEGITTIGDYVFYNCTSLESVIMPDTVTVIGDCSFGYCTNLTSITVSNNVTYIAFAAFEYCSNLTSITIPNTVGTIGYGAFRGCTSLTTITIPDSVTWLEEYAFYECKGLTSATIGNGVTNIGEYTFGCCNNLMSVALGSNLTYIGQYAFCDCANLESIVIPNSVTGIGDRAFIDCTSLINVKLPDNITNIGWGVFGNCKSLVSITIPDSVTSIGDAAFCNCESLTSINIPVGVTSIGDRAFDLTNLKKIYWDARNVENLGCDVFYLGDDVELVIGKDVEIYPEFLALGISILTFDDGVTSIGDNAFSNWYNLTSVTIPSSIISIGDFAFSCASLVSIVVDENNDYYSTVDGVLFNKEKTILIQYPIGKSNTSYTIPDSVTSIGDCAFLGCESLTSINIPVGVTSIGDNAFELTNLKKIYWDARNVEYWGYYIFSFNGDVELDIGQTVEVYPEPLSQFITTLTFDDGVASIGAFAFDGWSNLKSIVISNSVTSIGESAFNNCGNITSIFISNSVTNIHDSAFYNCTSLTDVYYGGTRSDWENITIDSNNDSLTNATILFVDDYLTFNFNNDCESYQLSTCAHYVNGSIVVPETYNGLPLTSIGDYAFRECSNLTSITIPDSVTSIGDGAFHGCESLVSVTIPCGVTSIEDSTFYSCSSLTSITIPDSVTSIGGYAFYGCTRLASITIPDSVKSIYESTFENCTSLTSITIPESVTSIGFDSFRYCTSLTSIIIPDSVTSIGDGAFDGCCNVTSLRIGVSVESIGNYALSLPNLENIYWNARNVSSISEYALFSDKEIHFVLGKNIEVCPRLSIARNITTAIIEDGVTSISEGTFSRCSSLTSIVIPDSVTSIGDSAFYECTNLISITIPNSITSIGDYAFAVCTNLTSIIIPEGVTSIGDYVFYECTNLASITIPNSVTSIGDDVFYAFTGTIYCVRDSVAHEYAVANNIRYVLEGDDEFKAPIQETENTNIDYDNFIIRTNVEVCDDITELLGLSEAATIEVKPSYVYGNLELLGTGTIVTVFDGDEYVGDFTLVVEGDINGDSICDALDAMQVALASNGHKSLDGVYALAADSNADDIVDANDYQAIVNKAVS